MFGRKCSIIGVVHTLALPGAAGYQGSMEEICACALKDALTYKKEGIDAIIVENMHDVPYLRGHVDPETTAAMAIIAHTIKNETALPIGVQLLAAANLEALGVAVAGRVDFIRVEGFVYAHVGDEGIHQSTAADLIRRRAYLKAEHIKIFADIKKKHSSHAITGDVSLSETARAAEFFLSDGVVVTGTSTGNPADLQDVLDARQATSISVLVGSGVSADNLHLYTSHADALIVGSAFKYGGNWQNAVDPERVARFLAKAPR